MLKIISFYSLLSQYLIFFTFFSVILSQEKDIDKQIDELLAKMTLAEKIGQMTQISSYNGEIPDILKKQLREGRIGSVLNESNPETSREIQRIAIEESRLAIPVIMGRDVIHGFRTVFPIPLGQAASWDVDLVECCARVAAGEAAAAGYHWTFAPMMDITHDPRWGRIAEGFGEDPCLAGKLAAAMVKGFQGNDLSASNTIAACAKHFAGYGAVEGGRDYNAAFIPEGLLRDLYLPPFKAAVEAGVATVMTSFNEMNGIPSSGNKYLLRHILREEWGFKGFVVSDWRSMEEMISHGFCSGMKDVAYKSFIAGVDMEMVSSAYADHLEELVSSGKIAVDLLDQAVRNILRIKFKLGLFAQTVSYQIKVSEPPGKKARRLASEMIYKSTVLLKNEKKILPLEIMNLNAIAMIGPLADEPYEVLGTWSPDGRVEDSITPLQAMRVHLALLAKTIHLNYTPGLAYTRSDDKSGFIEAVDAAKKSDIILFFAGEEAILSGEAHCRADLDLPGVQNDLILALAETGRPIVLIIMAGRPLTIGAVTEKVQAVLYAWHPGTMCGPALIDLIFGLKTPSGKLPVTFPKSAGQIPVYYNHKNTGRPPGEGRFTLIDDIPVNALQHSLGNTSYYLDIGYLPLYPFGYGLSYTLFNYDNLVLFSDHIKVGDALEVSVDVTNIGQRAGEEVVQLYLRDPVASLTRPVKELKGFQRIDLKPQEKKTVHFNLSSHEFGFYNNEMNYIVEPGRFQLWIGGDSQSGLTAEFDLVD